MDAVSVGADFEHGRADTSVFVSGSKGNADDDVGCVRRSRAVLTPVAGAKGEPVQSNPIRPESIA